MVAETKKSHLTKEPGVRTKLFIADETIGLGKIDLLEKLGEVGSISAAARKMGMSYKIKLKHLLERSILQSMDIGMMESENI